jgi:hypothetical protein
MAGGVLPEWRKFPEMRDSPVPQELGDRMIPLLQKNAR